MNACWNRRFVTAPRALLLLSIICAWSTAIVLAQTRRSVVEVQLRYSDGSTQSIPATRQAPPPATQPRVQPSLGVNLTALNDWDPSRAFIDAMKSARRFGSTSRPYDEAAPVTPDGWPTSDAGVRVLTGVPGTEGKYRLVAKGRFTLQAAGGTVQGLRFDEASTTTTAEVSVQGSAPTLELVFRETGGTLRDVKLLRPGYDDDREFFTKEFLNALQPFSGIRFMDWLRTNNSQVATWEQRGRLEQATWRDMVPYEACLELGLRTGKAVWLNIPALADDEYVRRLGDLIRSVMPAEGPPAYVEHSNEVWNGQFLQFQQNLDAAVAAVRGGDQTLNLGGSDANQFYWAWRRVAKRSVEIKQLLGPHPQLRVVLCSQVGYGSKPSEYGFVLRKQLEYVARYFGPPSRYFYAVACAPYCSAGRDETDPTGKTWYTQRSDLTPDLLARRLLDRAGISAATATVQAFHALAAQYGLASFAYEGGLDLQQFPNRVDVKTAAQYRPEMGEAVEQYLNGWWDGGGSTMFYFVLASKYDRNGYWGLTENVSQLSTPKYQGALRAARRAATLPAR